MYVKMFVLVNGIGVDGGGGGSTAVLTCLHGACCGLLCCSSSSSVTRHAHTHTRTRKVVHVMVMLEWVYVRILVTFLSWNHLLIFIYYYYCYFHSCVSLDASTTDLHILSSSYSIYVIGNRYKSGRLNRIWNLWYAAGNFNSSALREHEICVTKRLLTAAAPPWTLIIHGSGPKRW